jgi:hypothetical protein
MNEALQLLITIGGAVGALSAVGGIIWKVAIKPRVDKRETDLCDLKEDVHKTMVITALSAKAIIAMADELTQEGKVDGRTVETTKELRDAIYKQVSGGF